MATQATADEEGRVGFFWGAAGRTSLRAEAPQGAGRVDAGGPRVRRKSDSVVEQPALRGSCGCFCPPSSFSPDAPPHWLATRPARRPSQATRRHSTTQMASPYLFRPG